MTKSLLTSLFVLFLATVSFSQWTFQGAWPDTNYKGGTHGIAVDPDGKVWTSSYYKENWIAPDTVSTSPIYVFNADGSYLTTIYTVTVNSVTDTLKGNCRGLSTDADGNILYVQSGPSRIIKINYQTQQGMAKHDITEVGSSPTKAAASSDGTIYVGPVVGGGTTAIANYDTDLNYLGNAVTGPANIARTMEVSSDGLAIYWTMFTGYMGIDIYTRPDELSAFALADSALRGMSIETVAWNPATGNLWVSNDVRALDASYTDLTWYEYDVSTKALVDSFTLPDPDPAGESDEFPRGLAFSPDGMTAYVGLFGTKFDRIYKFTKGAPATVDVEFQVDMGVQAYKGLFNPATDAVKLAGNFNEWNNGADVMTDPDGDTVYTITKSFTAGENLVFKFIKGADGWENDPNREYTVPGSNSVYYDYFNRDNSYQLLTPVNITFACNMEFEIVSGRFNPATDTLSCRGSFNGWSSDWMMDPSVGDPNIYEVTKTVNTFEGETFNYKFAYITGLGTNWEGDPNKTYTVTASDLSSGFAFTQRTFNDATLETVTNQECTIKFTVDVTGAISAINLQPLAPVTNVRLCGANPPLRWPGGGWPDADINLTIECFDDGTNGDVTAGDNIWSREVTFPQYSPLRIQYKYGANWGLATNQGGNDNEAGVGDDHFINLTPTMTYGVVNNAWGSHVGDTVLTSITDQLPGNPTSYNLAQNFPNPFNPSTSIQFSIPEAGLVTLKVFTLLGEEVATLVNEYVNAGSYNVKFDASKLTTGVYFYNIKVNDFSSTKKMILTK